MYCLFLCLFLFFSALVKAFNTVTIFRNVSHKRADLEWERKRIILKQFAEWNTYFGDGVSGF